MRWLLGLLFGSIFTFSLLCIPNIVLADTYGSGSYGGGVYGNGQTNNGGGGSSTGAVGSAIAAFFCTKQAPATAPNLYQITVTGTSATVYFAPAGGPYDRHFISYGQGNTSEGYGIEVAGTSTGALTYQINQLSPSIIYTFKVRGGNGCEPGSWSNTLTVKTQGKNSRSNATFYPQQQVRYVAAKPASWTTNLQNFVGDLLPQNTNKQIKNSPAKSDNQQSIPKKDANKQTNVTQTTGQTSWWSSVTNFFSHLFTK